MRKSSWELHNFYVLTITFFSYFINRKFCISNLLGQHVFQTMKMLQNISVNFYVQSMSDNNNKKVRDFITMFLYVKHVRTYVKLLRHYLLLVNYKIINLSVDFQFSEWTFSSKQLGGWTHIRALFLALSAPLRKRCARIAHFLSICLFWRSLCSYVIVI